MWELFIDIFIHVKKQQHRSETRQTCERVCFAIQHSTLSPTSNTRWSNLKLLTNVRTSWEKSKYAVI